MVVTGAAGGLGRRVLPLLLADPAVERRRRARPPPRADQRHPASSPTRSTWPAATSSRCSPGPTRSCTWRSPSARAGAASRRPASNLEGTRRLLAAASANGVRHVVAVSSATVYGAWPNNPVPLTEDAPLRPNPDVPYAVQKSYVEHLVADWALGDPAAHGGRAPAGHRPGRGGRDVGGLGPGRGRQHPVRRGRPAGPVRAPRRPRHGGRPRSAGPPRRPLQRGTRWLDRRRHRAGAEGGRAAAAPAAEGGQPARAGPLALPARQVVGRAAVVRHLPVGRGQRPPAGRGLGAAAHQRAGLRGRDRCAGGGRRSARSAARS